MPFLRSYPLLTDGWSTWKSVLALARSNVTMKKIPQFLGDEDFLGTIFRDLPLWSSSLLLSTVLSHSNCRDTCQASFPPPPLPLNMPHFVHVKTGALQGHKLKPGDKNITAVSAGRKRIRMLQIGPFRILTGQTHESHAASLSASERIPLK